ncbi:class I SAM-dependent methyltransferase [Natrialbaceae archaeon AArc-T1-2]|uniref:class I SAM-dependent methyltransferase n=1 Tax=Natrialbaceae archaeon AArc-T1-2 TaxID=3053904 RepID=UPI00255AEDE1|nr:class I SAM-dependent methyltransferase [Natrialbaceae archaeon AArc-T1-2]WIV65767.1 class I SAM-dependent methyltransferase [Natrialbaceae archaeon AArc-T1-2]
MSTTAPFETLTEEYDGWYEANAGAYRSEQAALERALPETFDHAAEIGVGTGRFAAPLSIPVGVDPAKTPLEFARDRGIESVRGVAEQLPIADDTLEVALVVATLCFVDDVDATLSEARRALADDGVCVIGTLDCSSPIGQVYEEHKDENPFYADAEFLAASEVCDALKAAGFELEGRWQTVFEEPATLEAPSLEDADVREGHGEGLFAVIKARPTP